MNVSGNGGGNVSGNGGGNVSGNGGGNVSRNGGGNVSRNGGGNVSGNGGGNVSGNGCLDDFSDITILRCCIILDVNDPVTCLFLTWVTPHVTQECTIVFDTAVFIL